jgi:phytoene dehydrogenase-like protein
MSTTKRTIGRFLVPVMAVMAFQLLSAGTPAAPATRTVKAVPAARTKTKITISLNHRLRRGTLVVSLDDTPIFNEAFERAPLAISQTTTWDPVEAPAGKHKLTAQVEGKNKRYLSATYELQLSRKEGAEIHLRLKGDKLTIEPTS